MNLPISVNQEGLLNLLLNIAPTRPVFIWGPPGIGKSALVEKFAESVGLPCVSLLGSQLAPEDIIGIPQIVGEVSTFRPPRMIARTEPYCLFLDELNGCSQEVQKAFYSLILEKRIGEYHLPQGSVIIGAGNRSQDGAIVKTMSTALINRMFHVQLQPDVNQWLDWGYENGLHPWVLEYIAQRPDHLFSQPPKTEEPYSTPRSWHMLSDALKEWGENITRDELKTLAYGCLTASHAGQFLAFTKQTENKFFLEELIKGTRKWPAKPEDRDVLYFAAQSFRARLWHDLPQNRQKMNADAQYLAHRAKALMKELASLNLEIAQMVVSPEDGHELPGWFLMEIVRDLPRLVRKVG
ncbi:MAG TPA: MoxR family ATPase [Candidatus Eisenbergiella stercorigallinarum]|uniref:MoxR family ATPase n=1 Tax=Candidatus Eisenbergiella stercorigallinarum TaxID=2838557 RepID=A0A9D2TXT6_9FIRM|nr:MoxR family ATPase [Candidatus Eisenbergiella stercorigallinarum]